MTITQQIEKQELTVARLQSEFEKSGALLYSDDFLLEMEKLAKLKRGEKC